MKNRPIPGGIKFPLIVVSFLAFPATANAINRVYTEGVNNYSSCNGPSLAGSVQSANDLAYWTGYYLGFTKKSYFDSAVWTSDFLDQDGTGDPTDDDEIYFDSPLNAISFFQGHGTCNNNGDTFVPCSNSSTCTVPPAGATSPGFCRRRPYDTSGFCSYPRSNKAIVVGNCTSGPPGRGGFAWYGAATPNARWGESAASGPWGGSGTNGGANVIGIAASCAEMSNRQQEIVPALAGAHMLLTTFVHWGDTADHSGRGSSFAAYAYSSSSSVADSWRASMSLLGSTYGVACTNVAGTQSNGGFYGVNGCGGYKATATGTSVANALTKLNETWIGIQSNATDATSGSYVGTRFTCNWDCLTFPFSF